MLPLQYLTESPLLFCVQRQEGSLCLVGLDGTYKNQPLALCEQAQIAQFQINPEGLDALVVGDLRATWGVCLLDDDLPAHMIRALGIGRSFRSLSYARRAVVQHGPDGPYLAHPAGGMLDRVGQMIHLYLDHALYSL